MVSGWRWSALNGARWTVAARTPASGHSSTKHTVRKMHSAVRVYGLHRLRLRGYAAGGFFREAAVPTTGTCRLARLRQPKGCNAPHACLHGSA
eukprot:3092685-Alexandrium_andersonii.AAC.1